MCAVNFLVLSALCILLLGQESSEATQHTWHVPHTHTLVNFANSFHLISLPFVGFLNMQTLDNNIESHAAAAAAILDSFLEFLIANNNAF